MRTKRREKVSAVFLLAPLKICLKSLTLSSCNFKRDRDILALKSSCSIHHFIGKGNSTKGDHMDPKLVKQFFVFLVLLFGWTVIILLIGPK